MRLFIILLIFSINSFANNEYKTIEFKEIPIEEFKFKYDFQDQLNKTFLKPDKKKLFEGTTIGKLFNKFSNTTYLSLKIKRSNFRENELKISFSKSSLALRYMLD